MRFNLWKFLRKEKLYKIYIRLLKKYVGARHRQLSTRNAIRIMDQEWNYLIVLDACRHDLFKEVVDENTDFVISGGSGTSDWLEWNFNGEFMDVIYIAGNPHLSSTYLRKLFGFNPFYKVIEVWDFGWDSTFKTVPPEEVTLAALETLKKYPDKRMIIHYNQPHRPFLSDSDLLRLDDGTWSKSCGRPMGSKKKTTIWHAARLGEVPIEKVWKGYKENLKLVMDEVKRLVDELYGKVVITSDHGNHLGEYMVFAHMSGLRTEELVKVPWLVVKNEEREVVPTRKVDRDSDLLKLETEMIKERIRQLKKIGKI